MAAIISDKFRIFNAKQFLESLSEGATDTSADRSRMYFFVGRPQPWKAYLEIYAKNATAFSVGDEVYVGTYGSTSFRATISKVYDSALLLTDVFGSAGVNSAPALGSSLKGRTGGAGGSDTGATAKSGVYRYATEDVPPLPLDNQREKIGVYDDILKPLNILSPYKLANAQLYVLASVFFKENQLDDALIKNENGNIIETTNSNLFISSNGVLYTPPLSEGCVGGIMRMQVINLAISNGMLVYENPIQLQHLLSADEIIITNSIKGIRWIGQYKDKRYYNSLANKLTDLLNQEVVNYQTDLMEN